jgi:hypothetical protein
MSPVSRIGFVMRQREVSVRGSFEIGARGPDGVVMAGPWPQRETPQPTAADESPTLERLTAKLDRLERREEALHKQVAELIEQSHQAGRLQALAESLRNSRDYKVDEVVRQVKDLRGRIEGIEGPLAEFASATHRSLVVIDLKLAELEAAISKRPVARGWLMGGVVMVALAGALVASVALAGPLV